MSELLQPVDAEQAVIDELYGYIPIGTKLPDPKPLDFARVVSAGGNQRNLVSDEHMVVIDVYSRVESNASRMAAQVLARLQLAGRVGRLGNETCYGVDTGSLPQNFPDPSVPGYYRYTMTLVPVLRRRVTHL